MLFDYSTTPPSAPTRASEDYLSPHEDITQRAPFSPPKTRLIHLFSTPLPLQFVSPRDLLHKKKGQVVVSDTLKEIYSSTVDSNTETVCCWQYCTFKIDELH